jgi:hypothetical protein
MIGGIIAGAAGAWRLTRDFAKTPIGRLVLTILFVLVAMAVVYQLGRRAGVSAEQAAQAARLQAGRKVVAKVAGQSAAITKDVRQMLETSTVEIRWRTQTLKQEVPVYVPYEVDRSVVVPVGFVRMHDAAALGSALPGAPDGPVDAPSGVALSAVAETVVDNYGACHVIEAEALAWRAWYARQADLWSKNIKAPNPAP